jgi:hypothetical protein
MKVSKLNADMLLESMSSREGEETPLLLPDMGSADVLGEAVQKEELFRAVKTQRRYIRIRRSVDEVCGSVVRQ